jgi:hypothetical protein
VLIFRWLYAILVNFLTEVSEVLTRLMTAGVVDRFRVTAPIDDHLQNYPPRAEGSLTPILNSEPLA